VKTRERAVQLVEVSHLHFNKEMNAKKHSFSVLFSIEDNSFRHREVNAFDRSFMINVLRLSSDSRFMMQDNDKRLKMTASATILKETRSKRLNAMLSILHHKIQEFVN